MARSRKRPRVKHTSQKAKTKASKRRHHKRAAVSFPRYSLPLGGVLLATIIAFLPMLWNGFTNWDDTLYVLQNPLLRDLSLDGLRDIFSTPVVSNYHPLTILTLAVNYQISGLEPLGYHLTNLLLHLGNTVLVYYFTFLLSKGNVRVSIFVATVFAIHPMHVESVAWVSERKDVLYTFFFLSALIFYIRYRYRRRLLMYVLMLLAFGASLLSKPAAVVLPVVLLLIDYLERRKFQPAVIVEKLPLFVLAVAMGIATLQMQSVRALASLETYSALERLGFAGYGFTFYLVKFVAPFRLSALHPFPEHGEMTAMLIIATIISLGILGYFLVFNKSRTTRFGILFYLVTVILVLQIVSVGTALVAERYTYLPYIGLAFAVGMWLDRYLREKRQNQRLTYIVYGAFFAVALLFGVLTFNRTSVWKDSPALWTDVLQKYPDSHRAYTNRGLHYYDQGKYDSALEDLNRALAAKPDYMTAVEWRGKTHFQLGRYDNALQDADKLIAGRPRNADAFVDRNRALQGLERYNEALDALNTAIELDPRDPELYNTRGTLYFNKLQNYQSARSDFERALDLRPNNGTYTLNLSRCYYVQGDYRRAAQLMRQAEQAGRSIDPAYKNALQNY